MINLQYTYERNNEEYAWQQGVKCIAFHLLLIIYHITKVKKLAPYGTDGQLLLTANFKVTWHKN